VGIAGRRAPQYGDNDHLRNCISPPVNGVSLLTMEGLKSFQPPSGPDHRGDCVPFGKGYSKRATKKNKKKLKKNNKILSSHCVGQVLSVRGNK